MKNNKTRNKKTRNKKMRNNKTKNKLKIGGRIERIKYTVSEGHLTPDLRSNFRIEKGPTYYKSNSKLEYFYNYIANASQEIEEHIAVILNGEPKKNKKHQLYEFKYPKKYI
jgi:hypothetical protein